MFFLFTATAMAAEYHVSVNGSDASGGSKEKPFRTIQKAADIMQPGDVCIVHEGVYREWVKPVRGGTSEIQRIVFKAAPGEKVVIKGLEQVKGWLKHTGSVWRLELPDAFFGSFNPFKTNVSGGWLKYGGAYHLGALYMNETSLNEKFDLDTIYSKKESYFIEDGPNFTTIYANFGKNDPNRELTEINVRECVFFPEIKGLQYITVDGFKMMHAAANWACFRASQKALIGTYWGKHWIIENCEISDARCTGLVCGNDPSREDEGFDVEEAGHHIIRNNTIRRCGQAGIHGFKGWSCSIIENNLIEDISTNKEFGGYETGGIKLHDAVDVIIRNNIIRRVYVGGPGQYAGIWIDWGAQGTRVTGNVVYDMEASALFLQNAHGPVLVDNNIFSGDIRTSMENCVYVHNLFIDCTWSYRAEKFSPVYWKPHTAVAVEKLPLNFQNDKNYNNIYTKGGTDKIKEHPGFAVDWNVYYDGALKSSFADKNSFVDTAFRTIALIKTIPKGVEVFFNHSKDAEILKAPAITNVFIGKFAPMGQGLENHDGSPFSVDADMLGNSRKKSVIPGPLQNLIPGKNSIVILAGVKSN